MGEGWMTRKGKVGDGEVILRECTSYFASEVNGINTKILIFDHVTKSKFAWSIRTIMAN
jgi:hypothetical protein